MGLGKQFVNNFVFPTWACAAGVNDNNKFLPILRTKTFSTHRNVDATFVIDIKCTDKFIRDINNKPCE